MAAGHNGWVRKILFRNCEGFRQSCEIDLSDSHIVLFVGDDEVNPEKILTLLAETLRSCKGTKMPELTRCDTTKPSVFCVETELNNETIYYGLRNLSKPKDKTNAFLLKPREKRLYMFQNGGKWTQNEMSREIEDIREVGTYFSEDTGAHFEEISKDTIDKITGIIKKITPSEKKADWKNCSPDHIQRDCQCWLFTHPTVPELRPEKVKKRIEAIAKKCNDDNKQVIIVTVDDIALTHVIKVEKVKVSIVRIWKFVGQSGAGQSAGGTFAVSVELKFLKKCIELEKLELFRFLTSRLIVLVEGLSDVKYLVDKLQTTKFKYYIHLEPVGGKGKLPEHTELLLQGFLYGLVFIIVCDGDAIVGGRADDVVPPDFSYSLPEESAEGPYRWYPCDICYRFKSSSLRTPVVREQVPKRYCSYILCSKLESVLFKILKYLEKDSTIYLDIWFRNISDFVKRNHNETEKMTKQLIEEKCGKKSEENAKTWQFCEDSLNVVAWRNGKCDIESLKGEGGKEDLERFKKYLDKNIYGLCSEVHSVRLQLEMQKM